MKYCRNLIPKIVFMSLPVNCFFVFLHYTVHVGEADQCRLNLKVKCRPLQVHLKIAEEPKWRKEGNGTTELESDLFIVSFEGEIG